ncbi:MAG: biotin/lipoate A/B protein ligase family protein [Candidatus Nanohaloarchaea archaeon]
MAEASVKIPAGKFVKVLIEDGDVRVRGDFFLEPPEALEQVEEALENVEGGKKEALKALQKVDAEFIGFSREHVAEAYAEAAGEESSGEEVSGEWRIVNDGPRSEAMHHALDEVLTERMANGEMQPTLRFWHRKNPAIPIGRFQSFEDEVEQDYVEDEGVEVVRRITGGGAMYSEPGDVITYSIYIPRKDAPGDIEQSYEELDRWAVDALNELGIDVDYKPLNDIEHEEGKVGGAAQLRKGDAVLHHTMLSYDLNTENMLKALRIGKEKVSDKAIESAEKRVAVMSDYVDHGREEVIEKMIEKFRQEYGGEEGELTPEELEEAEELAEEKFESDDWNRKM